MEKEIRNIIVNKLETRVATDSTEKIISGYINKFNTRSQYMGFYEEVATGAFDKTLADGHNIFSMFNHNDDKILGSTRANSLKLSIDEVGLAFELRINDKISYANDLYELVQEGSIDGCSFGFYVIDDSWVTTTEGIDLRIIKEIELIECTLTPFPAYLDSQASCRSFTKFEESKTKDEEIRLLKSKQENLKAKLLIELEL
ncbi:HK97 family phage prohead protease [Clostridium estertheticum]|uniref:HK97 family phage prohead protease n=1 Tax=Clostridium estertheticum TaxID=238834 RepID=UPI001C0D0736|nr:HK97 family phage prohead protease [Clostridium estertheticum]MBU3216654.1 HK97 family phage prohead protease [Clostridium estertheticum]MCB2340894.1 HK97 family phage prohead protease [Clostridium estertheticum]WAG54391.1 HK97 family phage prohead protease [Clostridium estertheticum]